jgi:hypothetical protein
VNQAVAHYGEAALHANVLDEILRRQVVGEETVEKSGAALRAFMNETGTKATVKRTDQGKLYLFTPQTTVRTRIERWRLFLDAAGVAYHQRRREAWLPNQQIILEFMPEMVFPGDPATNARAEYLAKTLDCYVDVIYGSPGQARPFEQRYFVIGYKGATVKTPCFSATKRDDFRGLTNVSIGVCKRHCGLVFTKWEGYFWDMRCASDRPCRPQDGSTAMCCADDAMLEGNRCMAVAAFG